jgi:spermidine synthase
VNAPSDIVYEIVTSVPTEAVVELYRAGGWWEGRLADHSVIPDLIRGSFCFLVARTPDSRIVGMGRAISDGVCDAYIQDVVVLREVRGRGIGREIVRRLTARCLEAGLVWIGLIAEPNTQDFYTPLGFAPMEGYQPMLHGRRG